MSRTYYNRNAQRIYQEYESVEAEDVHRVWSKFFLDERDPGLACDIGAGSGRDTRWLAKRGWEVVAVEPASAMLDLAKVNSPSNVLWFQDSLPELARLRSSEIEHRFDLILLNGVWMHISPSKRARAFRILTEFLKPSGLLVISYRNVLNNEEARERGFFDIADGELDTLAASRAVLHVGAFPQPDLKRAGINWKTHVFKMPSDGTENLPLLRRIIINDNKSASYKLGLLRVLVQLAETAPGIVVTKTDDYVEIPFGAVGLYWIRQYGPLILEHELPQRPPSPYGYGFAKEAFHSLFNTLSPFDLRLGGVISAEVANILRVAIKDACVNIKNMPVKHINYPESSSTVFECDSTTVRRSSGSIELTREYLLRFGRFRIPRGIWQAMSQFACWLEPVIVEEWQRLHQSWNRGLHVSRHEAFRIPQAERDTKLVRDRVTELNNENHLLACIWSNDRIGKEFAIDHCFPWSRWPNNDLWNLLPTKTQVNSQKGDKLPSSLLLDDAKARMLDWWDEAWLINSSDKRRFLVEASYAFPDVRFESATTETIYEAVKLHRLKLSTDQQIPDWTPPKLLNSLRVR